MSDEVVRWVAVPGFEGAYEVSDQGEVRSLDRVTSDGKRLRGRPMRPSAQTSGYLQVHLQWNGQSAAPLVHRLVLSAFVGPPAEGAEACHGNGDQTDNRLSNLRWDTRLANVHDSIRHGTHRGAATTCPQGHPYEGANLGVNTQGARFCRACARARSRRKALPTLLCVDCGVEIPRAPRGGPRKWCDSCR